MDVTSNIKSQADALALLQAAWEASAKNAVARSYMAGVIDALTWAGKLEHTQYEIAYETYIFG